MSHGCCRWLGFVLTIVLGFFSSVLGVPLASASETSNLTLTGMQQLTGNAAGSYAVYPFTMPGNLAVPGVTVNFSPAYLGDGRTAGFNVILNGVQVAMGTPTGVPGQVSTLLPGDQTGLAVVAIFSYAATPVSFTIATTNVPGSWPNGPVGENTVMSQAAPVNGSLSEVLPGNTGGSVAYFDFPTWGATPPSYVELSYSPADAALSQAVGFNVYDAYGNVIASAQQPASQNSTSAVLQAALSRTPGEQLLVQVYNYAPGIRIIYRLSISGVPLATPMLQQSASTVGSGSAPVFHPFWVENFRVTALWSGPDEQAESFGDVPQFSSFLVVKRQQGPRLYVLNPLTHNYAYIDADAVGPSGPPH